MNGTKFAFVLAEWANHAVATLCRVIGASVSGFYAWFHAIPTVQSRACPPPLCRRSGMTAATIHPSKRRAMADVLKFPSGTPADRPKRLEPCFFKAHLGAMSSIRKLQTGGKYDLQELVTGFACSAAGLAVQL